MKFSVVGKSSVAKGRDENAKIHQRSADSGSHGQVAASREKIGKLGGHYALTHATDDGAAKTKDSGVTPPESRFHVTCAVN